MKIRIINENDWEKVYELDKSIIRVGSQVTCDIQLMDSSIQPLMMQIVRSGGLDEKHVARFFTDGIILTRGDQVFPVSQVTPYEILDGDKFLFSNYRMIISLEDEKTRIRTSTHISAEMFLTKRDLSLESAINGMLVLKNLGTEKPCQFRLRISGIPNECVQSAPMPYLYPGSSSTVGFIISHLHIKPAPGFHTVSLTVSAPEDYFGEELEFNQDIYVHPVFDNIFELEDDSKKLTGFNKKQIKKIEPVVNDIPIPSIPDTHRMNVDEEISEDEKPVEMPVRIVGADDSQNKDVFAEPEEEEETYKSTRKKRPVVVIHNEKDNVFDEPDVPEPDQEKDSAVPAKSQAAYMRIDSDEAESSEKTAPAEPGESSSDVPALKKKRRKKKNQFNLDENVVNGHSDEKELVRDAAENAEISIKLRKKQESVIESENERAESITTETPVNAAEEKSLTESTEISKVAHTKKARSKRVKKEIITDSSFDSRNDNLSETFDTVVEPISEPLPAQTDDPIAELSPIQKDDSVSEPLPIQTDDSIAELLPTQTVEPAQDLLENEKVNENADFSSDTVSSEEMSAFEKQPVENDIKDVKFENGNGIITETGAAVDSPRSMDENMNVPANALMQIVSDGESTELQQKQLKIDSDESVDREDVEIETQSKPNFVNAFRTEGNMPVAVVSGKGNFDDPAELQSEEPLMNPDDSKPEVIVVKGGGFDQ